VKGAAWAGAGAACALAAAAGFLLTRPPVAKQAAAPACQKVGGMVRIPAGTVALGEDSGAPRTVAVDAFWIDRSEVSNRDFAAFVAATGHRTQAEHEGASPVFSPPRDLSSGLGDASQWWRLVKGADWRHPDGPGSDLDGLHDVPVVHVAYDDALAFAKWKGRALPDEAQWERAARGGRTGLAAPGAWAYDAEGRPTANTWQGVFPVRDQGDDHHRRPAPAGCFAPNGYGAYDMIGNVWEWTRSDAAAGRRLIKGGSYLCAFNYCASFRPAARQIQEQDLGAGHLGFRTVSAEAPPA